MFLCMLPVILGTNETFLKREGEMFIILNKQEISHFMHRFIRSGFIVKKGKDDYEKVRISF